MFCDWKTMEQTDQTPVSTLTAAFHCVHLFFVSLGWYLLPYFGPSVDQTNNSFYNSSN